MLKYKFARGLAWMIIAAGAILTALFLALVVNAMLSEHPLTGGAMMAAQNMRGALLGIGIAMAGFICHAIFDATEHYLLNARQAEET